MHFQNLILRLKLVSGTKLNLHSKLGQNNFIMDSLVLQFDNES